jgi:hypothetical protein
VKKPHYTKLLKAFVDGKSGGLARIELYRLELIKPVGVGSKGPVWKLSERGERRARRLGYLNLTAW